MIAAPQTRPRPCWPPRPARRPTTSARPSGVLRIASQVFCTCIREKAELTRLEGGGIHGEAQTVPPARKASVGTGRRFWAAWRPGRSRGRTCRSAGRPGCRASRAAPASARPGNCAARPATSRGGARLAERSGEGLRRDMAAFERPRRAAAGCSKMSLFALWILGMKVLVTGVAGFIGMTAAELAGARRRGGRHRQSQRHDHPGHSSKIVCAQLAA